jgi:hypothetical protein
MSMRRRPQRSEEDIFDQTRPEEQYINQMERIESFSVSKDFEIRHKTLTHYVRTQEQCSSINEKGQGCATTKIPLQFGEAQRVLIATLSENLTSIY